MMISDAPSRARRRARRRQRSVGSAAAGLLLVVGCSVGGPDGQPLLGARLASEAPSSLEVEFSGCDAGPKVDVFESASTVRVTLAGPNGGCEPIHELTVELDEPFGDRTLVDGATGDEVQVGGR